jgi:excisionase family DNA binding protein
MNRKSNPHQLISIEEAARRLGVSRERVLISIEEAARRLGVSRERVRQIIKNGLIESYQLSGWDKVFVLRDEVNGYLAWNEKERG